MRMRKHGFSINLDSLLDTMTNGVGMLIIILAVTQLSVGHTVREIRSSGKGLSATAKDESDLKQLRETLKRRTKQLADSGARTRELSTELESRQQVEELAHELAEAGQEGWPDPHEVQQEIQGLERQRADLLRQQTEKNRQVAEAEVSLAGQEDQKITEATLPVLRDAPDGARVVQYVCQNGKVYLLDRDRLHEALRQAITTVLGQPRGDMEDLKKLAKYLDTHDMGDDCFRVRVLAEVVAWSPELRRDAKGETADELERSGSRYQEKLKSLNPKRDILLFWVWRDSFDTYCRAKKVAGRIRPELLSNWEPFPDDCKVFVSLTGASERNAGAQDRAGSKRPRVQ